MARFWSLQLRPVLVVWLLLTVPVVCHHQTAEMILGALVTHGQSLGGHAGHQPPAHAVHPAAHHGGHALLPDAADLVVLADRARAIAGVPAVAAREPAAASAPLLVGTALGATEPWPASEARWCAHRSTAQARFLPEGQGSVALRPVEGAPQPGWHDQLLTAGVSLYPRDQHAPPPAPPPRLAA